jgi:hypothetical protein
LLFRANVCIFILRKIRTTICKMAKNAGGSSSSEKEEIPS